MLLLAPCLLLLPATARDSCSHLVLDWSSCEARAHPWLKILAVLDVLTASDCALVLVFGISMVWPPATSTVTDQYRARRARAWRDRVNIALTAAATTQHCWALLADTPVTIGVVAAACAGVCVGVSILFATCGASPRDGAAAAGARALLQLPARAPARGRGAGGGGASRGGGATAAAGERRRGAGRRRRRRGQQRGLR